MSFPTQMWRSAIPVLVLLGVALPASGAEIQVVPIAGCEAIDERSCGLTGSSPLVLGFQIDFDVVGDPSDPTDGSTIEGRFTFRDLGLLLTPVSIANVPQNCSEVSPWDGPLCNFVGDQLRVGLSAPPLGGNLGGVQPLFTFTSEDPRLSGALTISLDAISVTRDDFSRIPPFEDVPVVNGIPDSAFYTVVPEPGSLLLAGSGLALLSVLADRRRRG